MQTLTPSGFPSHLKSAKDLEGYFLAHRKPKNLLRVGVEAEFFGVDRKTGHALPYDGERGIEAILKFLASKFYYAKVKEKGRVIALSRRDLSVTLEPGGQVELTASPASNIFQIKEQVEIFTHHLKVARHHFKDITWLMHGIHPFSSLEDISWVPKGRYAVMKEYLKTHGTLSHHMMKRTCTAQMSFDYLSEEDAMEKFRMVMRVTSIVTALFANSSFSEGSPNGYQTKRLDIWNHTDPDRTGLLARFMEPGATFQDYLDTILDMPMLFLLRNGEWLLVQNKTFRQFIHEGYEDHKATFEDFELHLTSAFPEARLKQFIEVRGIDGIPSKMIPSATALWKGLLYDPTARREALQLVANASVLDIQDLHQRIPKEGLRAQFLGRSVLEVARELVEISRKGLNRQAKGSKSESETVFLDLLEEQITGPGKSPADRLLEVWETEMKQDPARLIEYLQI